MSHHIVSAFTDEMESLSNDLLRMGGIAETMIIDACQAVVKCDVALGARTAERDPELDALEESIKRRIVLLLALRQPMAQDLRSVLAALKQLGHVTHAFGPAQWWGADVFGIDNALVGDWPVVSIKEGKARIEAFGSIPAWLSQNSALLKAEMYDLSQMWNQRLDRRIGQSSLQGRGI